MAALVIVQNFRVEANWMAWILLTTSSSSVLLVVMVSSQWCWELERCCNLNMRGQVDWMESSVDSGHEILYS